MAIREPVAEPSIRGRQQDQVGRGSARHRLFDGNVVPSERDCAFYPYLESFAIKYPLQRDCPGRGGGRNAVFRVIRLLALHALHQSDALCISMALDVALLPAARAAYHTGLLLLARPADII